MGKELEKIKKRAESELYASMGAISMISVMEGKTTDGVISIRDKAVEKILDLFDRTYLAGKEAEKERLVKRIKQVMVNPQILLKHLIEE